MKQVPYNTGKVLIGSRYEPPKKPVYLSIDEERLQRALLGGGGHNLRTPALLALYALTLLSTLVLLSSL